MIFSVWKKKCTLIYLKYHSFTVETEGCLLGENFVTLYRNLNSYYGLQCLNHFETWIIIVLFLFYTATTLRIVE